MVHAATSMMATMPLVTAPNTWPAPEESIESWTAPTACSSTKATMVASVDMDLVGTKNTMVEAITIEGNNQQHRFINVY